MGSRGVTDARGGRANGFGGLEGPIAHPPLSLAGRDGRAVVETKAALFNYPRSRLDVQRPEEELVLDISKPRMWLRGGRFAGTTT